MKKIFTGIQPSGIPHIGNYQSTIKILRQVDDREVIIFIADLHSITSNSDILDASTRKSNIRKLCSTYMHFLPDATIFLQSDIPEITCLTWFLSNACTVSHMERIHSYKASKTPDLVSMSTMTYPILMASDILGLQPDEVIVGQDQTQHVELTRQVAKTYAHEHGIILGNPNVKYLINDNTIYGADGRKMSKSYNNTISMLSSKQDIENIVMKMRTDSSHASAPKDYNKCNIYRMVNSVVSDDTVADLSIMYQTSGWYTIKEKAVSLLHEYVSNEMGQYKEASIQDIRDKLRQGANSVRPIIQTTLDTVKKTLGCTV